MSSTETESPKESLIQRQPFIEITPLPPAHRYVLYGICFGFGASSLFSAATGGNHVEVIRGGASLTIAAIEFFIAKINKK